MLNSIIKMVVLQVLDFFEVQIKNSPIKWDDSILLPIISELRQYLQ